MNNKKFLGGFTFKKKKKAFALIVSLFLMSFLVLLVITLSVIVQMELRSAKQSFLDQRAKNAAKLAAFQALAEVQKALGPDQRITANAKILDNDINEVFDALESDESYAFWSYDPLFNRDDVNSVEGISNPNWLGVWDSTPGMHPVARKYDEDKATHAERVLYYATNFLVSGNHSIKRENVIPSEDFLLSYNPETTLSTDYINMLRKNSITDEDGNYDESTMRARVPLVTIPKTEDMSSRSFLETRIAWWVSDESQKAPVNVLATEDEFELMESSSDKVTLLQTMPFKNGIQSLSLPDSSVGLFDVDLNAEEDRNKLRALNEISQLDLLMDSSITSVSAAKFLYNSVAMDTKGLMVNVRDGGLRKDLSVGLLARNPSTLDSDPNYFERPMGVVGYDAYLTNPVVSGKIQPNKFSSNSLYTDLKGHMFGAQDPENVNLAYTGLNYALDNDGTNDTSMRMKDPGGPLWDSLREYYNNRVDKDGLDAYTGSTTGSYANKIKTKTDVTTGLSPVVMHYQLFTYPTLSSYGSNRYGVRVYFIPLVVLWNPYDIDIEAGSTFAFKHGYGSPNVVTSFRLAIGVRDESSNKFKAIRDIRTESMPRPMPTLEDSDGYYTYMDSSAVKNAKYSFSSLYSYSQEDINAYRAFSWSYTTNNTNINTAREGYNIVSVTVDGKITDDDTIEHGYNQGTMSQRGYPINKSYFGYGKYRYEDTKKLVSDVEDAKGELSGTTLFPSENIADAGLVRIYEKGTVQTIQKTMDDGTTVDVDVPDYYYLSPESFYYRKLYLNNLIYSLGYTGQISLSAGGALDDLSESDMRDAYFDGDYNNTYADEALRFLIKTEEALKPGEAKIFTLKCSVPYHYTYDGKDGYAGNFAKALSRSSENENDKWYLTEGVNMDSGSASIGGFFVDVMHPERTYLASASANNYNGDGANRPYYDPDNYKNMIFDPMEKCKYDGLELGVLLDLSDDRNRTFVDDAGQSQRITGVSDIALDFDKLNESIIDKRYLRARFLPPFGYVKAESLFNPNPWRPTSTSTYGASAGGADDYKLYFEAANISLATRQSEIVMWNYADDSGEDTSLYMSASDDDGAATELGTYDKSSFQSLKRYSMTKNPYSPLVSMQSFPDPTRVAGDRTTSGGTKYSFYFATFKNSNNLYGMALFPNATSVAENVRAVGTYDNPATIEQNLFYSTEQTDTSKFDLNSNYTSAAPTSSLSEYSGFIRSKVRGKNYPMYNSSGYTIFDGYYKNLMEEFNLKILAAGLPESECYDTSDETAYTQFLKDLELDTKYENKAWVWEDPYFLMRNPRRISEPYWSLDQADSSNTTVTDLYVSDNLPQSFTVQSQQVVDATQRDALTVSSIIENDGKSLVYYEGITAYRPVSDSLESTEDYFYQYPFKFPWLTQSNATAKVYGDGVYGNAGAFRDGWYGTGNDSKGGSDDSCLFYSYGAMANNFQHATYQLVGEKGTDGNYKMDEWFSLYIDKFSDDGDGVAQVQVGPDVLSSEGYEYTLKHYLRNYEIVSSVVDLSTADLAFGADQSRTYGVGTATADMYYPNNLIGSSYSSLRIAPERYFDYLWMDSFTTTSANSYNPSGDKKRGDGTVGNTSELKQIIYDMAWHLNDLLWDEYFFSTIPYRSAELNSLDTYYQYLVPKNPRIQYINAQKDKIYVRIELNGEEDVYSMDNNVKNDDNLTYDFDVNSARFWVNGPFNVNSTDVDAWKMVLATSFGNAVYGLDGSYKQGDPDKAPMPRNTMPYTAQEFVADGVRGNEQSVMQGYRALSRTELEELALSLVENIKDRGPFFSLAQFVNRTVELRSAETIRMGTSAGNNAYDLSNDFWENPEADADYIRKNANEDTIGTNSPDFALKQDHMQKGVMQAAIDLTVINQAFFDEAYLVEIDDGLNSKFSSITENDEFSMASLTWGVVRNYTPDIQDQFWALFANPRDVWENYRAVLGSTLAGAPTYLTQVDILKQIGSFITVRGDTFKIRAYGEIRNPLSEEVESKAWCEMLVQRYPEYIDATANTPVDVNDREKELGDQGTRASYDSLLQHLENTPVNKYLGRRFKVVSFRWLSEREI